MKIPERYRGQVLLCMLVIILPLLIAWFSFGSTIKAWIAYKRQTELIVGLTQNQNRVSENGIENITFSGSFPNTVFPLVTKKGCSIDNYLPYTVKELGKYTLETHQLIVKGDYISMIQIIEEIENEFDFFRIISVEFSSIPHPYGNNINELKMTMLIQSISTK